MTKFINNYRNNQIQPYQKYCLVSSAQICSDLHKYIYMCVSIYVSKIYKKLLGFLFQYHHMGLVYASIDLTVLVCRNRVWFPKVVKLDFTNKQYTGTK